ncbi:hydantoinase/oxoprolinase family protein [Arthrobacter gyeryongensis]|uniref:Hydantoinase/oxoprolinase family protein n=1 Tax=Arthrobacter gyeryongensis TaxID=1650592 RepID=A0ABP9SMX5_9MICC
MSYQVGVDVGGTFTDFLLVNQATGVKRQHKTSTTPADPSNGILNGLSELAVLEELSEQDFFSQIELIVHGTTVATNAVLTGRGAKTGLITTEGFRDILEMRRGIRSRKHLYDNKYVAPAPLVPRDLRKTVSERVDVDGNVVTPLEVESLRQAVGELVAEGVEAIAVCFVHSYQNAGHEQEARKIIEECAPGVFLSISAEVLPQIRLYPRISTTAMNAYLGPVVQRYMKKIVGRLAERGAHGTLMVMQSNGGITLPATVAHLPASITMSGPAAGPVAALAYVAQRGWADCTVVDMGGTSFDASLVKDGEVQITREGEINRHVISLPTTHVNTIGAGGGSIAWIDDGGMLRVGPQSAGADPGPVAYGKGGEEPTVTDAGVVLGYIDPDYFLGGRVKLRSDLAAAAIANKVAGPLGLTVEEAAAGIYEMVNLEMAAGTKNISVERGYDPREFPMVVAGGAGPVHAGMIAHELEIPVVVIPRLSSVLCAAGMLMADLRHDFVRAFSTRFSQIDLNRAHALITEMSHEGDALLDLEGVAAEDRAVIVSADMRYIGQHHEVIVSFNAGDLDPADPAGPGRVVELFHSRHEQLYGFSAAGADLEMLSLRVAVVGRRPALDLTETATGSGSEAPPKGRRDVYLKSLGRKESVPVYDGQSLPVGQQIVGPAIVEEPTTTVFVPEFFDLELDGSGSYVMTRKNFDASSLLTEGQK